MKMYRFINVFDIIENQDAYLVDIILNKIKKSEPQKQIWTSEQFLGRGEITFLNLKSDSNQ